MSLIAQAGIKNLTLWLRRCLYIKSGNIRLYFYDYYLKLSFNSLFELSAGKLRALLLSKRFALVERRF